jgi:uroporphyrinogen decarboxylase
VLVRQQEPDRVPFIELFADSEIIEAVLGEPVPWVHSNVREEREALLPHLVRFWYTLGYDAFWIGARLGLPVPKLASADTALLPRERREWVNERAGAITCWADFDRYPWPRPADADYGDFEFLAHELPDGMAILGAVPGVLEPAMQLMGYQTFALALYDQPALVAAVFDRLAEIIVPLAEATAQMDRVGAIWMGDDLAFRTSTMISVKHLQQYVFPIQKRIAAIAHNQGLPFILHSCGNRRAIMDILIEEIGIDGIHSFEDAIEPVTEAKSRYGDRIAILGGVDVDFLCRADERQIRAYVRRIIAECAPSGGYALGTGNSVTNYIPVQNYLTMLDEGYRCGRYPIAT